MLSALFFLKIAVAIQVFCISIQILGLFYPCEQNAIGILIGYIEHIDCFV